MFGEPGHDSADAFTSYIAPIKKEVLNKNSIYEYSYYIIVGSIERIRAEVYDLNKIESK